MNNLASQTFVPDSVDDLIDAVRSNDQILAVGQQTKRPLSSCADATLITTTNICGITEYEPSEFTFTAKAGTPIHEIESVLAEKQQYLPFDPMLVDNGATLGGTVASGLSGPGRFRYGGVRDFLLGVQLVLGDGTTIRAGGKVVKNAAGFDIPKLMVGSCGRLGILTEMTFKVFPKPPSALTVNVQCDSHESALDKIATLARSRLESDAIDYHADDRTIWIRFRGNADANREIAHQVEPIVSSPTDVLDSESANQNWESVRELTTGKRSESVIKVPVTRTSYLALQSWADSSVAASIHLSVAGSVAWISLDAAELPNLHRELCKLDIAALAICGESQRSLWGYREPTPMHDGVKLAIDPDCRFPEMQ